MKKINTFLLFAVGKALRPIEDIDENTTVFGPVMFPLYDARAQIRSLLENDALLLKTSRQAATQLVDAITAVVPLEIREAVKLDKSAKVEWWPAHQIKKAATTFETVLAEELNIIDTYAVAQKGAYSTSELISNAEAMFSKTVQRKLPALAVQDIREAGKCLAFETPTAAGFHIVRAIESVILAYFTKVLGRNPPSRMRNWGVYIRTLRESGKADSKILDFLSHIKDNYRNPVSHPDAVLTVDEVLVLFGVAVAAITQMSSAL